MALNMCVEFRLDGVSLAQMAQQSYAPERVSSFQHTFKSSVKMGGEASGGTHDYL